MAAKHIRGLEALALDSGRGTAHVRAVRADGRLRQRVVEAYEYGRAERAREGFATIRLCEGTD